MKRFTAILTLLTLTSTASAQLENLELPPICDSLPSVPSITNFTAVCRAAMRADPFTGAATCQRLEEITAEWVHVQATYNDLIAECHTLLQDLQRQVLTTDPDIGTEIPGIGNSPSDRSRRRPLGRTFEEADELAQNHAIATSLNLPPVEERYSDPARQELNRLSENSSYTSLALSEAVLENIGPMMNSLDELAEASGAGNTMKETSDMLVRNLGELGNQNAITLQLLSQMIRQRSTQAARTEDAERWSAQFFEAVEEDL